MSDVSVEGVGALRSALNEKGAQAVQALGAALYQEAEEIMARSKASYVPVDTGALRASGQVTGPAISGTQASVVLGYGNSSVKYALIQHENLSYKHTVGQAKYLEQPVNEALAGMPGRLATRIRADWSR